MTERAERVDLEADVRALADAAKKVPPEIDVLAQMMSNRPCPCHSGACLCSCKVCHPYPGDPCVCGWDG